MMDKTSVIDKTPFISGNSPVITITGVPNMPKDEQLFLKPVTVDGTPFTLATSYMNISKRELEEKPSELYFKGGDNTIKSRHVHTIQGALMYIEEQIESLEDNERLRISLEEVDED